MTFLVALFALVLASSLQAMIPGWSGMGYAKMPLVLAVVVYFALTRRFATAMVAAICSAIVQDAQSLAPLGLSVIPFLLVACTINRYREEIFVLHPITHALCGATSVVVVDIVMATFLALLVEGANLGVSVVLARCVGGVVLGALTVPFVYQGLWRLDLALGNVDKRGLAWR